MEEIAITEAARIWLGPCFASEVRMGTVFARRKRTTPTSVRGPLAALALIRTAQSPGTGLRAGGRKASPGSRERIPDWRISPLCRAAPRHQGPQALSASASSPELGPFLLGKEKPAG